MENNFLRKFKTFVTFVGVSGYILLTVYSFWFVMAFSFWERDTIGWMSIILLVLAAPFWWWYVLTATKVLPIYIKDGKYILIIECASTALLVAAGIRIGEYPPIFATIVGVPIGIILLKFAKSYFVKIALTDPISTNETSPEGMPTEKSKNDFAKLGIFFTFLVVGLVVLYVTRKLGFRNENWFQYLSLPIFFVFALAGHAINRILNKK